MTYIMALIAMVFWGMSFVWTTIVFKYYAVSSNNRQDFKIAPLGATAFSPDSTRPLRISGISALSGILPADPALTGDGAFLSLSGLHVAAVALDYGRATAQIKLASYRQRFHRHQPDPLAP